MSETTQGADPGRDDLMARYGITRDGEKYRYGQYRYDRLEDAVSYAKTQQPEHKEAPPPAARGTDVPVTTDLPTQYGAARAISSFIAFLGWMTFALGIVVGRSCGPPSTTPTTRVIS